MNYRHINEKYYVDGLGKVDHPCFVSGDTITYVDSTGSEFGGMTYEYREGAGWYQTVCPFNNTPKVYPGFARDTDTPCTKENTMHEHINDGDARYALKRAINDAQSAHIVKAREVCHMDGFHPKNLRELRDAFIAGHFEGSGDDKAMEEEFNFGISDVTFRKAPADETRFNALRAKIEDEADAIRLKIKVVEKPETVLPFVESYKARTFH